MRRRYTLLIAFIICLAALGTLLIVRPLKAPILVDRTDPPKIQFDEDIHELGTVIEGTEVPYVFKIHNVGGELLTIDNVHTSCGCTLLNLKDRHIEPGKSGELEIMMDTTMKQGPVKKSIEITSNDPETPVATIYIAANVIPREPLPSSPDEEGGLSLSEGIPGLNVKNPHAGLTKEGKAKIFTGDCASCHVSRGKGKLGKELYMADCAMCHGNNAKGAVGPSLIAGNYHDNNFVDHIQQIIRYGSPTHPSMPGFLIEAGGPLTNDEINSLVNYLKSESEAAKQPQPAKSN